ncbi:hypothetical protein GCM10007940_35630 [Portibacter lacus]|uniref:Cytochrome c domain-containing protein n=2 Tax=Portibacter lacus TaxID=1099794 RepID=A0AA37SRK9_9BACT|nr:hypothetical protein GCM10007940_35630 [Portibacter lacus]
MDSISIPEGFVIEKLYTPSDHEQGSWVSITKDDTGRFYASDQFGKIYKVTVPDTINQLDSVDVELLDLNIGQAQGLLWHRNVLYALVNSMIDKNILINSGFYKITDENGDGEFDKVDSIRMFPGEHGEHGPHNILLGPDEESLYMVFGNMVVVHDDMKSYVPKVWEEDNLLPIIKDPSGHVNEITVPGGWVARTDLEGKEWEIISVGMRNTYDIAFNQDDELFGFDSDMEYDIGMPWYRPIRLTHLTKGSEFGWRKGTGKFRDSYPDNLPGIANLGQGSPTGLMNGEGLRFPAYYQNGLFLFDWSYGTMYFASLTPNGSSYSAKVEQFLSGVPLPLTNGIIGDDGAMYFCTGGRDLSSGFYKLTYEGELPHEVIAIEPNRKGVKERKLRNELEMLQVEKAPEKLNFIIKNLDHKDRFIRFSARTALENQDYALWKNNIDGRNSFHKSIAYAIAMARQGEDSDRLKAAKKLIETDYAKLSDSEKIDITRAIELQLIRMDAPLPNDVREEIAAFLRPFYLESTDVLNKELCKVLSYLQDGDIIEATLERMEVDSVSANQKAIYLSEDITKRSEMYGKDVEKMLSNMPNPQNISYALSLSELKEGWTPELRKRYFNWFYKALKKSGGHSYIQFIRTIQENALKNVPVEDRQYFEALASEAFDEANDIMKDVVQPKGPGQNWTVENVVNAYAKNIKGVDHKRGENLFKASLCASCHSVNGLGRNTGPELTRVGTRFSLTDLATAIVSPSATISDRFQFTEFHLTDDRTVAGLITKENDYEYILATNAFSPELKTSIRKKNVISQNKASYSSMPPGLLNRLNEKELSDLIAYLMAGGNEQNRIYRNSK